MWQKVIGVLDVSWADQGDEWGFHLQRILGAQTHSLQGEGGEDVVRMSSPGGALHTRLVAVKFEGHVACAVTGEDGDDAEDQFEPWRAAAHGAVAEVGKHDQDFTWRAIIGPDPRDGRVRFGPLAEAGRLGPVLLTPGGVHMGERWAGGRGRIDSPAGVTFSWPVIVSGAERTYDVRIAENRAWASVHRACALLSLSVGHYLLPRSGPAVLLPGLEPITVPQAVGDFDTGLRDLAFPDDINVYKGHEPLVLPAWAEAAWAVLDRDLQMREAVDAVYEAMCLELDHPSAAYLLHVAAIEGIGKGLVDLTVCDECGSLRGAGRRFRAALRTVLNAKQVRQLAGAYERRSQTGHQGSLHGSETTFGIGDWSLFRTDPTAQFEYVDSTAICNASRRVVVAAIKRAAEQSTVASPLTTQG